MTREEAINEIRSWDFLNGKEINAIQTLIPELRESEDERIIEEIKFAVMQMPTERQDTKNRCLTWLEKQKEQGPQEPQVFCEAKAFDLGYKHGKEDAIKEQKSVWSEKDENIRKQLISICDEWLSGGYNARPCLDDVRWLKNLLEKQKEQKHPNGCFTCDKYKKGYEEGRRNGFTAGYNKAMKEVEQKEQKPVDYDHEMWKNCEANFEGGKKEVIEHPEKYGLQKPAEWNEEEIKILDSIIDDYEKAAKSFCGYTGKIQFLKAIRDGEYNLPKLTEWSEKDKYILKNIHDFVKENTIDPNRVNCAEECLNWLKSLPKRFNLQPQQEWSKEDEKHMNLILRVLNVQQCWDGATGKKFNRYQDEIDWLKSLRPKPHWKPSEEQISSLKQARDYYMSGRIKYVGRHLSEIAEQLEKLM